MRDRRHGAPWAGLCGAWALALITAGVPADGAQAQGAPPGTSQSSRAPDYPTVAVADYVLACMAANGEGRDTLERCACSIDVIGTLLPFDAYEEAETFLSLGLVTGERGVLFRTSEASKEAVDRLRRAQIEAELRCF